MSDRRHLRFESLDAILPEVERLRAGHRTLGRWSLGQICDHLASATRLAVDAPADTRHDPSLLLPPERTAEVFATERLPEGLPLPSVLGEPAAISEAEGAERLRSALDHYRAKGGPVAPHRYFGALTKEKWERLVCIHCAHHLGFAVPDSGA
jgi:hypothetical protein